jgi:hypothetical protein
VWALVLHTLPLALAVGPHDQALPQQVNLSRTIVYCVHMLAYSWAVLKSASSGDAQHGGSNDQAESVAGAKVAYMSGCLRVQALNGEYWVPGGCPVEDLLLCR